MRSLLLEHCLTGSLGVPVFQDIRCCSPGMLDIGAECIFYPIGRRTALKIYSTKGACTFAFKHQQKASRYNFGPPCWRDTHRVHPTAELITFLRDKDFMSDDYIDEAVRGFWAYGTIRCQNNSLKKDYEIELSIQKLKNKSLIHFGKCWTDAGPNNMKFLAGKPVIIDFGPLAFDKESDCYE